MEKERVFGNPQTLTWHLSSSSSAAAAVEMAGERSPELPAALNLNWDQPADQTAAAHFESALSSIVSSPASNFLGAPPSVGSGGAADSAVIRELIGRLGSICNSGEVSPSSKFNRGAVSSCYATPLSSPPKLNLSMVDLHQSSRSLHVAGNLASFSNDPGFAERAARFSCFGGGAPVGFPDSGYLSRVPSSQSIKASGDLPILITECGNRGGAQGPRTPMEAEFKNAREESSASDPTTGTAAAAAEVPSESNSRKRKAAATKCKGKETTLSSTSKVGEEDCNVKRCKSGETHSGGGGEDEKPAKAGKQGKEINSKLPEPPKDYIHVRARRGQATDSHSLAERVRREKISERMKFLQDLVPGCNKVTGKAVMLDEIINYVQSLQHQVEFLSMKLATLNPRLDFNMETFMPSRDIDNHQPKGQLPHSVYQMDAAVTNFSYALQHQLGNPHNTALSIDTPDSANHVESSFRRMLSLPADGFADASAQLGPFWEDDLQSVVQMAFGQSQEDVFISQSFQGSLSTTHMKIEP